MSNENEIHPCWKLIGVWGDGSCRELPPHVHCRNCDAYAAAAARLLDREPPPGYFEDWTTRVAEPRQTEVAGTKSIVIFSLGGEWLALPTTVFQEVTELRPVHSLPHRSDGIIQGLVNIRGELLIIVSLRGFLSLGAAAPPDKARHQAVYERLLVACWQGERLVFAVDEVTPGQRYRPDALQPLPSTLALAAGRYSTGLLPWHDRNVGVLDEALLFPSLNRHLA